MCINLIALEIVNHLHGIGAKTVHDTLPEKYKRYYPANHQPATNNKTGNGSNSSNKQQYSRK
jgi:hypothetical protein